MPVYSCSSLKKIGLDKIIDYLLNIEIKDIKTNIKKDEKWLPEKSVKLDIINNANRIVIKVGSSLLFKIKMALSINHG